MTTTHPTAKRVRSLAALFVAGTVVLTVPNVALTDVANPDAVYARADDEPCPDAADLTLQDVQVNDYGCDVTELDALYDEDATSCYYSVLFTCDQSGGGCNN